MYGGEEHESNWTHELAAGAASFAGMKAYEDHQRKGGMLSRQLLIGDTPSNQHTGKPVSHAFAKEAIAGLVGAEVDKLAETKGMDEVDKIKAKEHAKKNAHEMYDEHYVRGYGAEEYDPTRYERHESFGRW